MNRYEEFFENLNEVVYMSDTDTYELMFLNKCGLETLGLEGRDAYKGKKCYEVLHDKAEPCSFCTNARLKKGYFLEWTFFNELAKRYYGLKDTLIEQDGRRLRLEIALDINAKKYLEDTVSEITSKEKLVNDALAAAMNEDDPDDSINMMLKTIGEKMGSDRVYIFEDNGDGTFDNTYEWCKRGVEPQIKALKRVPYVNVIEIWYNEFDKNRNIVIQNLEDYEEGHKPMYDILKPQNIKTLVVAPIVLHGRKVGFYGVDNPPLHEVDNISTIFEMMGKFMASLLRNRDSVRKAVESGYTDYLTGLRNRSAMQIYLRDADPAKSQGYIFCDINGLKKMNDEQGHSEGDALISSVADVLSKHFGKKQVFRLGGDEFLAVRIGISKDELDAEMKDLREDFDGKELSVAIGWSWRPVAGAGFDTLFREADERMYADKRDHYGERRAAHAS